MSSLDKRQTDLSHLHPIVRERVEAVLAQLKTENLPFVLFEAYRSPQRQRHLLRSGKGVTNADAWQSPHQYGLAVDLVLDIDGVNPWETKGKYGKLWDQLHVVARENDLEPLSWEKPHLELKGFKWKTLKAGQYPANGDIEWAENLEATIIGWGEGAPPVPKILPGRPSVPGRFNQGDRFGSHRDEMDGDITRPSSQQEPRMSFTDFSLVQPFIEKWEGGYVNNPHDKGGPTNMGITLATLTAWRGQAVSAGDVQALTRAEARQIFKARYFDPIRAGELPPAACLMVYNIAVLSGPAKAVRFLQQALGRIGLSVEVDDDIGPETLGAVAQAEASRLAGEIANVYEAYLRALDDFIHFGKGWMNRLNAARSFAATMGGHAGQTLPGPLGNESREREVPHMPNDQTRPGPASDVVMAFEAFLRALNAASGRTPGSFPMDERIPANIPTDDVLQRLQNVLPVIFGGGKTGLGPVNGALGQTIGNLLNGRKSAIGIGGALITAMTQQGGLLAGVPALLGLGAGTVSGLLPVFIALGAWGAMGKMEKWTGGGK